MTRGDMHLVKINGARGETETGCQIPHIPSSLQTRIPRFATSMAPSLLLALHLYQQRRARRPYRQTTKARPLYARSPQEDSGEEGVLASEAPEYGALPPWSPGSIEAISICFAMGVPRTALLDTPVTHPVHRLVEELKWYGVGAHPLDMLSPNAGRDCMLSSKDAKATVGNEGPILLVSTLANTRGLDLPDLSHVFVMGVPEGRVGSYTHIAGRTGRFGKTGKAFTVVEKTEEEIDDEKGGRKKGVVKGGES